MTIQLQREAIHAMVDIAIDKALEDLKMGGGRGLSMQGLNGPHFSIMFIAGEHEVFHPRTMVARSLDMLQILAGLTSKVDVTRGLNCEETAELMKQKMAPKPPSAN